jgi:hypothetical protein
MVVIPPKMIADAVIKALDERERKKYQYDVFLSYAVSDESAAIKIRNVLSENNIQCFMSWKELRGGDDFGNVIRNALQNSREICILFTPNSAKSEWVMTEWGAAWVMDKRITPVIHRTDITSLPDRLKKLHAIDLVNIEQYAKEVKDRISAESGLNENPKNVV